MAPAGTPSPGDTRLVAALARGLTGEAAARAAQVSLRTVRRREADPHFRTLVAAAQGRILQRPVGLLVDASVIGVEELVRLATNSPHDHVRLAAATRLVELGFRGVEIQGTNVRLDALEARLAEREARANGHAAPVPR